MKAIARIAASAMDQAPEQALEDALGLAAICLLIWLGFAATGLA